MGAWHSERGGSCLDTPIVPAHVAMYFFKNVCWLAGWLLAGWLAGFVRLDVRSFFSFCFFAKTQEDNKRRVHQVQLSTRTDLLLSATAASPPASAAFLKSLQNSFLNFFFFLFIFYRRKAAAGLQCVEKRKKNQKGCARSWFNCCVWVAAQLEAPRPILEGKQSRRRYRQHPDLPTNIPAFLAVVVRRGDGEGAEVGGQS